MADKDAADAWKAALGPTPDCLSVEQMAALHRDAGPASLREHLAQCPHCQAQGALYAEFLDSTPDGDEQDVAWVTRMVKEQWRRSRPAS